MTGILCLRRFIGCIGGILEAGGSEPDIIREGGAALGELVSTDSWLPEPYTRPDPERYQQYLLHCDSLERFSVVSFVWGPGQRTPIHDHCTWGINGVLRGGERSQRYDLVAGDEPGQRRLERRGGEVLASAGSVDAVSPRVGDIHAVWNDSSDEVSIGIHVYGGNIGRIRRHVYDLGGATTEFVSGYANTTIPNIWGS